MEWEDDLPEAQEKIRLALQGLDQEKGVLILVDLFGGTPCRAALSFLDPGQLEVLAGVNLPIVVRLGCSGIAEQSLEETAQWLLDKGRSSICLGSEQQCANTCSYDPCAPESQ